MANKQTLDDLRQLRALPLNLKVAMTKARIRDWVNEFGTEGVYISFSGGKDSIVLLDIVRSMYPEVPSVFCDTGLEYPEIRDFVKTFDNVVWLKPNMTFRKVIETYGYPLISKEISQKVYEINSQARHNNLHYKETNLYNRWFNKESDHGKKYPNFVVSSKWEFLLKAPFSISDRCCRVMKKDPVKKYEKETGRVPFLGTMAEESRIRLTTWLKNSCNAFDAKRKISTPMAFWREQDVLHYIKEHNLPICSVYGGIVADKEIDGQMDLGISQETAILKTTGCKRTGCMFCGFGCHLDKPNETGRFERMKVTHPKQYEWIMKPWDEGGLGYKEVIDWINEHGNLRIRY